jgi:hypothetical protein
MPAWFGSNAQVFHQMLKRNIVVAERAGDDVFNVPEQVGREGVVNLQTQRNWIQKIAEQVLRFG